jgi:asparagine synthetase B (glutamine-hydrolysing)
MTSIRVLGPLNPNVAWNGARLYRDDDFRVDAPVPYQLRGAATSVRPGPRDSWRVVRDPLGLNKLFWACGEDGHVEMAARPRTLIDAGHSLDKVSAVPRGCVVDLTADDAQAVPDSIIPNAWFSSSGRSTLGMEESGREIRSRLERYMATLAATYPSAPVFVCLSGGLDSSGVTAIAHEHFPQAVAVSFDLIRPGKRTASQDRLIAQRLARDLDMPLLEASVSEDQLFANIDTVLVEGIDWRDFNVHAALVNAALAAAIDETLMVHGSATPVIVLTGDLANEFLIDYQPEQYKAVTYYDLPRLRGAALRTSLVRGLDTCHREVGVFAAWGLSVVQPYAVAADAYLALDAKLLGCEDSKQRLCREIFGSLLPDYVYSRPKTRAQVGDPELGGGVLAACADHGFDGAWLRHRFARLHSVTEPSSLERFIRAGRYRTAVPSLSSEVQ